MFCRKCGEKIPEGNKFCEQCGTPVIMPKKQKGEKPSKEANPTQGGKSPKEAKPPRAGKSPSASRAKRPASDKPAGGGINIKKKYMIPAAVVIVVVAAGLGIFAAYNTSSVNAEYNDKLDTANKYVSEGDYDSAINTFSELIDIKPKREEAYLGLADIYMNQGRYDEAEKIIKEGEKNSGSPRITDKKKSIEPQKANQKYLKDQDLATVDTSYDRGEDKGGLISSITLDEVNGNPRWLDVSLNDKNRELTITIRTSKNGKITKVCDTSLLLGRNSEGADLLGAKYDIYTATGNGKAYLCIGLHEIVTMDTDESGIIIYEIGKDSLEEVTKCSAWVGIDSWGAIMDGKNIAEGKPYETDGRETEELKKGIKTLNDKIESLGLKAKITHKEDEYMFLPEKVFFDNDRKDCDKHISHIQFGDFEEIYDSANYTLLKDYTNLRKSLGVKTKDKEKANADNPIEYFKRINLVGEPYSVVKSKYQLKDEGGTDAFTIFSAKGTSFNFAFIGTKFVGPEDWNYDVADTDQCDRMSGSAREMLGINKEMSLKEFEKKTGLELELTNGLDLETSSYEGMGGIIYDGDYDPHLMLRDTYEGDSIYPDTIVDVEILHRF